MKAPDNLFPLPCDACDTFVLPEETPREREETRVELPINPLEGRWPQGGASNPFPRWLDGVTTTLVGVKGVERSGVGVLPLVA